MKRIAINENGIHMVFEVRCDKVRLVHFSALPLDENTLVPRKGGELPHRDTGDRTQSPQQLAWCENRRDLARI